MYTCRTGHHSLISLMCVDVDSLIWGLHLVDYSSVMGVCDKCACTCPKRVTEGGGGIMWGIISLWIIYHLVPYLNSAIFLFMPICFY